MASESVLRPYKRTPASIDAIPTNFHSCCGEFFFLQLLQVGNLVWGWDPSLLSVNICSWDIFLDPWPPHMSVWPAPFMSLPLLPVLTWLLLYILSYRSSVQLVCGSSHKGGCSVTWCGCGRKWAQHLSILHIDWESKRLAFSCYF